MNALHTIMTFDPSEKSDRVVYLVFQGKHVFALRREIYCSVIG